MELEVVLPDESPSMPATTLIDLARAGEDLGYATAWLPDHVLPPSEYGATFGGVYEPLVTIAHLAAVTDRIRFGTSVLVTPLRDPFVLAKQVATIHQLSAGRMILGLGVGWNEPEFVAVGADYARRGEITDDVLDVLDHLFAGRPAPYRGGRFSYERGVFAPIPKGKVPIMIGGNSDAALRRAARHGDIWQDLPTSPRAFAERRRRLADLTADRDVAATLRIGWDAATVPVDHVVNELMAYRDAGAIRVAVHFGEHRGTRERMEILADAVTSV